jgi:hypothetical protein
MAAPFDVSSSFMGFGENEVHSTVRMSRVEKVVVLAVLWMLTLHRLVSSL